MRRRMMRRMRRRIQLNNTTQCAALHSPGSVMAMAEIQSPLMSLGRYSCFISSEPES
jgi:hypothetical protein